jgi:hypothetical protein
MHYAATIGRNPADLPDEEPASAENTLEYEREGWICASLPLTFGKLKPA